MKINIKIDENVAFNDETFYGIGFCAHSAFLIRRDDMDICTHRIENEK